MLFHSVRSASLLRFVQYSFIISLFCFSTLVLAQGKKEDYQRAELVKQAMDNKVYNAPSGFNWLDNEHKFWYVNPTANGKRFILVDVKSKSKQPAFDHAKLASALSAVWDKNVLADSIPFSEISFVDNGKSLEFQFNDTTWKCDLDSYKIEKTTKRPDVRRITARPLPHQMANGLLL
jgi:hypothetical protein